MRRRLVRLSLVGFGLGALLSCSEAARVAGGGAPGSGESGGMDQVRLGFGLDLEGKVSKGCTARGFAPGDPIHLSVQVACAEDSVLDVTVREAATERVAWSERRPVPAGRSVQTFAIGTKLSQGRYRAEPAFGGVLVSREFEVGPRRARTP